MSRQVIAGIDKSERMVQLALASSAMFGFPAARLHLANALALQGAEAEIAGAFDGKVGLILTNPPFGATFSGRDLNGYRLAKEWAGRIPGSLDSELLFCERYTTWLRPGGQLLAVVPDSILTNKGVFSDLRRGIAPDVDILSVTSLPSVTFAAAGTTTKCSVLHLRKHSDHKVPRSEASFFICEDVGFTVSTRGSQRKRVSTGPGDLPMALAAHLGDPRAGNPRRVVNLEDEYRWDAAFHASLDDWLQERIHGKSDEDVCLGDVAILVNERCDPRKLDADEFPYIEISDLDPAAASVATKRVPTSDAPSRARKIVRSGDVLVSLVRPERRAVAMVRDHQDGAICTTGLAVLRPTGIHPLVLARLLQSDVATAQLLRNNVGIAYPAIEESCLPDVLLPISRANLTEPDGLAATLMEAEVTLAAARADFDSTLRAVSEGWGKHPA